MITQFNKSQKELRRRILEVSFKNKYSHLGSVLSAIDLIYGVYKIKKTHEKFILSNGHAALALYVVLESIGQIKNPKLTEKLRVHPDRNLKLGIHVSSGSLGHGLPIAVGIALAERKDNVYCMISDGECAEGSIWEALRVASEQKVHNLQIILNANGWGAYDPISTAPLLKRFKAFGFSVLKIDGHNLTQITKALKRAQKTDKPVLILAKTIVEQFPFLKGQDAHYFVMGEEDYNLALKILR